MAAAALREQLNALLSSMFASVSPASPCVPVLTDRIGTKDLVILFFFVSVYVAVAV
jgi:hypothetical protein